MMKARKLVALSGGLGFIVAILAVGMHAAPAAADDPSPSTGNTCPWPCAANSCGRGRARATKLASNIIVPAPSNNLMITRTGRDRRIRVPARQRV